MNSAGEFKKKIKKRHNTETITLLKILLKRNITVPTGIIMVKTIKVKRFEKQSLSTR